MADSINVDVSIPTFQQFNKYFEKFRAFMPAQTSAKAKEQGAGTNPDTGNGWYFLCEPYPGYSEFMRVIASAGVCVPYISSDNIAGLRVAMQLKYQKENPILKTCAPLTREAKVWEDPNGTEYSKQGQYTTITSTAPIITFGKKEYIWLNQEDCESGNATEMDCWSLDLLERAVPIDVEGKHNNILQANELLQQADNAVKGDATPEELAMLVRTTVNRTQNYDIVASFLEENKGKKINFDEFLDFVENNQSRAETLLCGVLDHMVDMCNTQAELAAFRIERRYMLDHFAEEESLSPGMIDEKKTWFKNDNSNNLGGFAHNDALSSFKNTMKVPSKAPSKE